jgi:hypothetical protein
MTTFIANCASPSRQALLGDNLLSSKASLKLKRTLEAASFLALRENTQSSRYQSDVPNHDSTATNSDREPDFSLSSGGPRSQSIVFHSVVVSQSIPRSGQSSRVERHHEVIRDRSDAAPNTTLQRSRTAPLPPVRRAAGPINFPPSVFTVQEILGCGQCARSEGYDESI